MSLVKAANVQIGTGPSASNNFHWRNLLDGLLRLSRGNAGSLGAGDNAADVMRVKTDNSVEFPGGIVGVLGQGQNWQSVSRAWNTTYTNSTAKAREVRLSGITLAGTAFRLEVETGVGTGVYISVSNDTGITNSSSWLGCVVPSGCRYRTVTTGSPTLSSWSELG